MRNIASRKHAVPEPDSAAPRGRLDEAARIAYLPPAAIRPERVLKLRPGLY